MNVDLMLTLTGNQNQHDVKLEKLFINEVHAN